MSQTVNYGLNIYTDSEVEALGTVRVWRAKVDGTDSDSNMIKLDGILKNIADSIPTNVVYVEANPTLAGTESVLNSIKIGSTKYKIPSIVANEALSGNETTAISLTINGTKYAIPQGTTITANPTLDGTETDLESIGIGGVNYAIPSGGGSSSGGGGGSSALKFTNVTASTWTADNTYSDYGYKCILSCTGVTADSVIEVIFDVDEAISGNYAPVCLSGADTVTIYSKVNTSITIPVIKEV